MSNVAVAFICDSHYVMPTVVAITSLIENKDKNTHYDIYLIAADLSHGEAEKFYQFCAPDVSVQVIAVSLKKFEGIYTFLHISSAAYLKFDLTSLIHDLDKVLYLDSDVIIQKDLSDLFNIDIHDYCLGAVKDIGLLDNIFNIENYFNTGVMLLNLKMMRDADASSALLNISRSANNLTYMDQDCFNILFRGKVRILPGIYNCLYGLILKNKEKYSPVFLNSCLETSYSTMKDIKEKSSIIHLVGYDKPWIYYDGFCAKEWDAYYQKSPFRHDPLKRKSKRIREFVISHQWTELAFAFIQYWQKNGLKFVLRKALRRVSNKLRG